MEGRFIQIKRIHFIKYRFIGAITFYCSDHMKKYQRIDHNKHFNAKTIIVKQCLFEREILVRGSGSILNINGTDRFSTRFQEKNAGCILKSVTSIGTKSKLDCGFIKFISLFLEVLYTTYI